MKTLVASLAALAFLGVSGVAAAQDKKPEAKKEAAKPEAKKETKTAEKTKKKKKEGC
jgi:hypothetical protein